MYRFFIRKYRKTVRAGRTRSTGTKLYGFLVCPLRSCKLFNRLEFSFGIVVGFFCPLHIPSNTDPIPLDARNVDVMKGTL